MRMQRKPLLAVCLLAIAAALVVAPAGLGFSTGIDVDNAPVPGDFAKIGCVACHGTVGKFKPVDNSIVSYSIKDSKGAFLNGPYDPKEKYTISIKLNEEVGADVGPTGNHAGFNLRTTAGKLDPVEGQSQISKDGTQATHISAIRTSWNVTWTPPASGAVSFQLFVNDVDGDGKPSTDDSPHELFFGLTDSSGAVLGGAVATEAVEYGISLQQYWIGLIGLAGMIFVMIAGYVFLKYGSSHNTDQKDR